MALRLLRIFGPAARIDLALTPAAERKPFWIQAAVEGRWRGHPEHDLVEFTPETFDQVIRNFRSNPSYKQGPDGYGCEPVVRLDYEHLSEMPPTKVEGATTQGIPAPGWVLELDTRTGRDGKVQLWALVSVGETLWNQIKNEEQRWTSVSIDPHGVDRETGADIGPVLTSLAITNNPFILGMEPMTIEATHRIAASANGACLYERAGAGARGKKRVLAGMDVWGQAESAEEAIIGFRDIFGLASDADAQRVLEELQSFEEMLASGDVPEGVDSDHMLSRLRNLLGLRTLATREEIFAEATSVLGATSSADPPEAAQLTQKTSRADGVTSKKTDHTTGATMSAKTLNARLASILNIPVDADDDTVVDRVKALFTSSQSLKQRLSRSLRKVKFKKARLNDVPGELTDEEVAEAVEEAAAAAEAVDEAQEAVTALEQLLEILESDSVTEVLSRATKLVEDVRKHGEVVEELNALKARLADQEVREAEEEIAAIAACHKVDERTHRLLLNQVIYVEQDGAKSRKRVNLAALKQIREDWPVSEGLRRQLLTQTIVAGPNGVQLGGPITGAGGGALMSPVAGGKDDIRKSIALCAGRNDIERMMSYLSDKVAGFRARPRHEQVRIASETLRSGQLPA